ncbi:MAG TPA: nitroreductase family deazaflavin-dependent oxidoreductase [Acidimicrobiales bacterium]|nr:nitroreductase family deazaflavin-dependent oxidoreductase [Acidimicrobiales bacterium]
MPTVRDHVNRLLPAVHARIYRATKGAVGGKLGSANILLLTTTGRKSGEPRTTPLNYFPDGDHIVLIASNGGQDRHPAWYLNIVADPAVAIQRHAETESKTARVATAEEKATLWPRITDWYKGYAKYQQKTDRDIPLVIVD